eukprot:COSAG06_NODE_3034_length_5938_cov_4.195239_2_plen_54_part_00
MPVLAGFGRFWLGNLKFEKKNSRVIKTIEKCFGRFSESNLKFLKKSFRVIKKQ